MKKIEKMIRHIEDEVCGAIDYAEHYVIYKNTKPDFARMYSEMATQELNHADYLTDIYKSKMDDMSFIPEEDKECWDHHQKKFAEKAAMVKLMLTK